MGCRVWRGGGVGDGREGKSGVCRGTADVTLLSVYACVCARVCVCVCVCMRACV